MSWRIRKIIAGVAAVILLAAWFMHGFLQNAYVNYPRTPDVQAGRTVAYAVKGIVVYITLGQQESLSWLAWIEISSGVVIAVVILLHGGDPFRSKK